MKRSEIEKELERLKDSQSYMRIHGTGQKLLLKSKFMKSC